MTRLAERARDEPAVAARHLTNHGALPRRFRADIEGLRAIAVVSVVLYHAHLGVRGGYVGVDVFFVISGYLITRQLSAAVEARRLRAMPEFYARRIKRLLPAAATVVIATVVVARIWGPPLQSRSVATDALFTTFYSLNYRLAVNGTQYLHQGDAVSPLQHFWSLGVEEQFYLAWPILIVVVGLLARRIRTPVLLLVLTALVVFSYRWSILLTRSSAPWAYFSLQSRAWELAIGALVAVGAGALARLPGAVAELGALIGLGAVLASCFVLSDASHYPGSVAMVPVGGAALVIACGVGKARRVERLLGESLMQCLGRVSYSWYLWHWPMLILTPYVVGHPLDWGGRVVVVWLSLVTAIASYLFIEDPARRVRLRSIPWLGLGTILSGAVALTTALVIANPPSFTGAGAEAHLASGRITPGSDPTKDAAFLADAKAAVATGMTLTAAPRNLVPQPQHAGGDTPAASRNGCHLDYLVIKQAACVFGDPHATRTVVIFGDSHMEQWEPAFDRAGKTLHWKVVSWTKSACPAADLTVIVPALNRAYTECDIWRRQTIARIGALEPDLVVVGESENAMGVQSITPKTWTDATLHTLDQLRSATRSRVVFMGDNPVPRVTVPDCVAEHLDDVRPCQTDLEHDHTYPDRHKLVNASVRAAGFAVVDPQSWVCSDTGCPPIVGNVLVYRDPTHLSVEYVEYLTPLIAALLTRP
jgi:peptidoglycan/LPS O-acetylase OafA/YrhL